MLILFQGDSITDAGRDRNTQMPNVQLGNGYVNAISEKIRLNDKSVDILNRGVGGDRTDELQLRWKEDTLDIKYDLLSILCGINDLAVSLRFGDTYPYSDAMYKAKFEELILQAKNANPDGRLILIEPFVFRRNVPGNEWNNDIFENWDVWCNGVKRQGEIVNELAQTYGAGFVPAFHILNSVGEQIGFENISADGVHLIGSGNQALADAWIQAYRNMYAEKNC